MFIAASAEMTLSRTSCSKRCSSDSRGVNVATGAMRLRRDVAVRRLHQAELAQVARERRLGDGEAVLAQRGQQLVLRMDGRLADDPEDLLTSAHGVTG